LFPNINPRELKRMLKRMGIDVKDLEDIVEVVFVLKDRKIIVEKPQVLVIEAPGQRIYQVTGGSVREERVEVKVSEEDVEFIVSQTGVSRDKAREALIKANGDIVEAIMMIKEGRV